MVREINKDKYVLAAIITLGIFLFGVLLGLVIEGKRSAYIESTGKLQNLEYNSLQLQYAFVDQLAKEENCDAISKTFENNVKNLESARGRLESFNENARISRDDFALLKREYVLAQMRYWLLARKTVEICQKDLVTVLYFFSDTEECPDCDNQAFVLSYLKDVFKDKLLIFSFDARQEDEPMVSILKQTYNITAYPSLVMGDKTIWGFMDRDRMFLEICPRYRLDDVCKSYTGSLKNETS